VSTAIISFYLTLHGEGNKTATPTGPEWPAKEADGSSLTARCLNVGPPSHPQEAKSQPRSKRPPAKHGKKTPDQKYPLRTIGEDAVVQSEYQREQRTRPVCGPIMPPRTKGTESQGPADKQRAKRTSALWITTNSGRLIGSESRQPIGIAAGYLPDTLRPVTERSNEPKTHQPRAHQKKESYPDRLSHNWARPSQHQTGPSKRGVRARGSGQSTNHQNN